jgi:hypothetical protein
MNSYVIEELKRPPGTAVWAPVYVEGLNDSGDVIGRLFGDGAGSGAMLWIANALGGHEAFLIESAYLHAINNSGYAVGTMSGPLLLKTATREVVPLPKLQALVGQGCSLQGINDSNVVCGTTANYATPSFTFDLSSDQIYRFGSANSQKIGLYPTAINARGDVAGFYSPQSGIFFNAFLFRDGSVVELGGVFDQVSGMNNSGQIAAAGWVGPSTNDDLAIVCDTAPTPPVRRVLSPGSRAHGINNSGVVVGVRIGVDSNSNAAWIWDGSIPGGADLNSLINDPNWDLEVANAINDRGQIVGHGRLNGGQASFFLTPRIDYQTVDTSRIVAHLLRLGPEIEWGGLADGPRFRLVRGKRVPIPNPWFLLSQTKRDLLTGLAIDEFAMRIGDAQGRTSIRRAALEQVRLAAEQLLKASAAAELTDRSDDVPEG